MLVHDLKTGTMDTLPVPSFDSSITAEKTDFFVGDFDDKIEWLPDTEPPQNTFDISRFSAWKRVSDDYDLSQFPLRTNAKIIPIEDNEQLVNCSGSMVSPRHLLTSPQCLFNLDFDKHNVALFDSILVCPGYDNGEVNPDFGCSYARKIYAFDNWSFDGEDLALIELEEPIGNETGWIGFGFEEDDNFFTADVFHKFSYPIKLGFPSPPVLFNGDTIYHTYGPLELPKSHFLWVDNRSCREREEGSSIIFVKNEEEYTSYGTLTYIRAMSHSRIDPWEFFSLKSVIENNSTPVSEAGNGQDEPRIFPNPTANFFKIMHSDFQETEEVFITDIQGKRVKIISGSEVEGQIDISDLPNGMYFLTLKSRKGIFVKKIIKQG